VAYIAGGTAATVGAAYYIYQQISKPDFKVSHQISMNESTHGGNLFAEVLKRHGVKHVFGLIGGHVAPIFVGCHQV
jgi:hypothetical protein